VRCFTFTSTGMTVVANGDRSLNETLTTPPVSHTGPSQVSFLPDGSGIIIIKKNAPPPASYLLYKVDATTNVPGNTPGTASIGAVNFAGAFDSDGTFVTVDAGNGVQQLTLSTSGTTPTITPAAGYFSLSPASAPCWIERSPLTGHFYTGNAGSGSVTEFSRTVSSGTATLTIVRQLIVGHGITDVLVAEVNGNDYLLVNGGATLNLYSLSTTAAPANYQNVTTGATHPAGLAYALGQGSSAAALSASSLVIAAAVLIATLGAKL